MQAWWVFGHPARHRTTPTVGNPEPTNPDEERSVRLQGQADRRGIVLVVVVLLLIAIAVAAYLYVVAPAT